MVAIHVKLNIKLSIVKLAGQINSKPCLNFESQHISQPVYQL
jgi:hypothetical protein